MNIYNYLLRRALVNCLVSTIVLSVLTISCAFAVETTAPKLRSGYPSMTNETADPELRYGYQDMVQTETPSGKSDRIELQPPNFKALITITKGQNPFQLDADGVRPISLRDVLDTAISQNLDIGIRQAEVTSKKWTLASSYGSFLPNLQTGFREQYLKGKANVPLAGGPGLLRFNEPVVIPSAGFTYWGYRGGKILFTALQNRNYYRAAKHQKNATLSDTLLESTRRYYDLLLNEALLQIRIQAVETSEAQLKLNQDLMEGGLATLLDVLQARTQLSSDRQALIDQQISRRVAAIRLADLLNCDQGIDLIPENHILDSRRLIDEHASPAVLLKTAISNRPELKQYEELRLAAKKGPIIASAPLQPSFQFFGNVYGIGESLSNVHKTELAPVVLPGGGEALVPERVSRQVTALYTIGYNLTWNFEGLGTTDLANLMSKRADARQAMLQLNRELNTVTDEVRQSYLKTLSAYRKLDETMAKVDSSEEELRLAQLRFQKGVGKNIDVLKAQSDYTSAAIENAQALIAFDVSQAQLLRDIGIISVANLVAPKPVNLE